MPGRGATIAAIGGRARRPLPGAAAHRTPPIPPAIAAAALAVTAALLIPPGYLLVRAASAVDRLGAWIWHPRIGQLLQASVLLAGAVTVAAVGLALPLAWLLARTDLPGRSLWRVLLALPLAIPSYVGAFALIAAVHPDGVVAALLYPLFGKVTLPRFEGFAGAWVSLTFFTYPFVLLPVQAAWSRLDPALEEAARSLGLGPAAVFRRVTFPLLRPAIASGALLVALYVVSDFGAVSLMRYETLTLAIYLQYGAAFDRSRAAVLALLLMAVTAAVHRLELASRRRPGASFYRSDPAAARQAPPLRLGLASVPAVGACALVALAVVGVPAMSLVHWLVRGLTRDSPADSLWGLEPFATLARAAWGSVSVASAAAAGAVVAAFPIAWLVARNSGRLGRAVEQLTFLSYGLPGIVLALSLVFFGIRFLGPLYQTLVLLVAAHVLHFLPQAVGPEAACLAQLNPRLEEVARSLGKKPTEVLRRVTVPLLQPGLLAGASLVFLTSIKELPATLLLAPVGFRTLATLTWLSAAEGFFARAALPGLLLLVVSGVSVGLLLRHQEQRWGQARR